MGLTLEFKIPSPSGISKADHTKLEDNTHETIRAKISSGRSSSSSRALDFPFAGIDVNIDIDIDDEEEDPSTGGITATTSPLIPDILDVNVLKVFPYFRLSLTIYRGLW